MSRKDKDLMARSEPKNDSNKPSILFVRRAAVSASLCTNVDFKTWFFDAIDDLRGFARDEGLLTDFGQGIRAAAARLQDRLLCAPEAVQFLADLYKQNLTADHERIVNAEKEGK